MTAIVFLFLLAACIGFWSLGAPAVVVFPIALAAWVAFGLVLMPKLRTYKSAMGLDDQLNALEAKSLAFVLTSLKGLKVVILGFLTSMIPFLGSAAQWLNGQNLNFFFDPNDPKAQQSVMFVIGAIVFLVPFVTSWLHSAALAEAAKTEPKG
jgi:hypothetical protein